MQLKQYLIVVLLGGFLTVSCQQSDKNEALPQENQSVVMAASQSARVGQDATLQIDKIEDSRCPANAICIRQGNVNVSYALSNGADRQQGVLCLGDCDGRQKPQDSTIVQLGADQYQLILTEVRPYPGTSPEETKPEAVIQVKKQ